MMMIGLTTGPSRSATGGSGRAARRSLTGCPHGRRVGEAPQPVLALLQRPDDLVAGHVLPGMAVRMRVLRGIAAADLAARHAHPQVYPCVAERHALLAARGAPVDVANLVDVTARHGAVTAQLQSRPNARQQSHGHSPPGNPYVTSA